MISLDVSKITEVDTDALEEKLQNRMKILVSFNFGSILHWTWKMFGNLFSSVPETTEN